LLDFEDDLSRNRPSAEEIGALRTLRLIFERNSGALTPVENLVVEVINQYQAAEQRGAGVRLKALEVAFADMRESLENLLPAARTILRRYPRGAGRRAYESAMCGRGRQ
jgi:hypothetical protein